MSRYIDAVPGSSIFHGTPRETPIFQSEVNPDPYAFSPTGSHHTNRRNGSLPRLEGDVDPYTLSASDRSPSPTSDDEDHHDDTRQRGKAGWWVHQSMAPSGRSSRRGRDLDDVYPSEESESEKASDPESEVSRDAGRMGRGMRRAGSVTDTNAESDTDGSSSGYTSSSSLVSTSTASALSPRESLRRSEHTSGRRSVRRDPTAVMPDKLEVYQRASGHWTLAALRRYRDTPFLGLWLVSLIGMIVGLCFVWGATTASPTPPGTDPVDHPETEYRTPFTTLLHTIPLLATLVLVAVATPLGLLLLLRRTVRPVLIGTAVAIPFLLTITAWWAFIASFEYTPDGAGTDAQPNWWGTTGLRWAALVPCVLAGISAWAVWRRRRRLEASVAVVELATGFLIDHPAVLLITPLILTAFSILSLPFLTLVLRLLLIGYYRHPREHTYIWHVRPYAGWLIALVTGAWLWTWVILRSIGRVVVAAVLGEWYFHRSDGFGRGEVAEVTLAAVQRATGPNLGSICASALVVAVARMIGKSALIAKRVTNPRANILPGPLSFLSMLTPVFGFLAGLLEQVNGYALVYVGITGEAFWPSARRAVSLVGRKHRGHLLDYTLVKLLLTLCSTTVALATATTGYLYATHTLQAPAHAPLAAVLCGGCVFLSVRAGMAVLADTADALFICYAIDRELGLRHKEAVAEAFSNESKRSGDASMGV